MDCSAMLAVIPAIAICGAVMIVVATSWSNKTPVGHTQPPLRPKPPKKPGHDTLQSKIFQKCRGGVHYPHINFCERCFFIASASCYCEWLKAGQPTVCEKCKTSKK